MRFTTAWSSITSQNVVLRLIVLTLAGLLALMSIVAAKITLRSPLIIERACYPSALESRPIANTDVEVDAFIKEVLAQRFDSSANPSADFMSESEFNLRRSEQDDLGRRQIRQRIVVNSWTREGGAVSVDSDRIVSVGSIRSALSFPLTLHLASVSRSKANPYGLVLTKVAPVNKGEKTDEK